MRVLFYGGCHAPALEKLFRATSIGAHSFESLENYKLINAGTPFPFERLAEFDALVFSPIRNKDGWNTDHLGGRCDALGIPTITYPWLQWNGYFPDVMRVDRAPHVWGYHRLARMAAEGATLDELLAEARDRDAFDPRGYADWSFAELVSHEAGVDIPVSDFIRTHYQKKRLFRTPDHPTRALYSYVQRHIAERLDIRLRESTTSMGEVHPDEFIILPGVRESLGLEIAPGQYRPTEWRQGIGLKPFVSLTMTLFAKPPVSLPKD